MGLIVVSNSGSRLDARNQIHNNWRLLSSVPLEAAHGAILVIVSVRRTQRQRDVVVNRRRGQRYQRRLPGLLTTRFALGSADATATG